MPIFTTISSALIDTLGTSISVVVDKIRLRCSSYPQLPSALEVHPAAASYFGWHQDSNHKYGDRPMLVAWIPLESDCGITKPSITILADENSNSSYNYKLNQWRLRSSNLPIPSLDDLSAYYSISNESLITPTCNLGDILVFNGMTFHCTSTSSKFVSGRYALILRFIPSSCENLGYGQKYYRHLLVPTPATS